MSNAPAISGEVVDLFCGVGALSHGLMRTGFNILAGYDTDARCKHAFEKNNKAKFQQESKSLRVSVNIGKTRRISGKLIADLSNILYERPKTFLYDFPT